MRMLSILLLSFLRFPCDLCWKYFEVVLVMAVASRIVVGKVIFVGKNSPVNVYCTWRGDCSHLTELILGNLRKQFPLNNLTTAKCVLHFKLENDVSYEVICVQFHKWEQSVRHLNILTANNGAQICVKNNISLLWVVGKQQPFSHISQSKTNS